MKKLVETLAGFEAEAVRFVSTLSQREHASLVTLKGELGAGKTAFTKVVARALGVEEIVNSPTFVLEKIYLLSDSRPFKRLIHIDAYRLTQGSDLAPLGFDELMQDAGNLILLEWPEKVADALPKSSVEISFVVHPNGSRTISYSYG